MNFRSLSRNKYWMYAGGSVMGKLKRLGTADGNLNIFKN